MKTNGEKLQAIYGWLAENLDCDTSFSGESASEFIHRHSSDWCEENCDMLVGDRCWQKYFDLKFAGKDGGQ